jgi:hypothetical protein
LVPTARRMLLRIVDKFSAVRTFNVLLDIVSGPAEAHIDST